MRVLLAPALERPGDPTGDSSLYWFADLADLAARRGWYVHLAVPEAVDVSTLPRLNVLRYPVPYVESRHALSLLLPGFLQQWVHRNADALQLDAIVTNDTLAGAVIATYVNHVFRTGAPDVFTLAASIVYPGADEFTVEDDAGLAAHALGAVATHVVAPSGFADDRLMDAVRTFLGPALYKEAARRTTVLMAGPHCELLDRVRDEAKFQTRTLYFGGRFTKTKGGERSVRQYVDYAMTGAAVHTVVTLVGGGARLEQTLDHMGASKLVQLFTGLTRYEAWHLMSRCHASMFYQGLKMLPSTPYEQMYCGLTVLFKNTGYERTMLPPNYPWVFEDEYAGAAMLRYVCENWEQSQRALDEWRAWVRLNVDRTLAFNRLLDVIERVTAETVQRHKPVRFEEDTLRTMERVFTTMGEPAKWGDVIAAFKRLKPGILMENSQTRGMMPLTLYRCFTPAGWVDTCDDPQPVFVKTARDETWAARQANGHTAEGSTLGAEPSSQRGATGKADANA